MFKLIYPEFWQKKGLISYLLMPLAKIYLLLGVLRKLFARIHRFNSYVICIGNVSVGGTGKTQLVIWLAKIFQQRNINFVILTKGYGSQINAPTLITDEHTVVYTGDEAKMLSKYGVVVASKKPQDAIQIINELNPQVIIMDDGMQNPNIYKDFTILTIDGLRGIGNEYLIPAGPLREKLPQSLLQAKAVVLIDYIQNAELEKKLKPCNQSVFKAYTVSDNENLDTTKKYYAFSGIGNPDRFFNTLRKSSLILVGTEHFPDHYKYSIKELEKLIIKAEKLNSMLITTAKDYVKIPDEFKDLYIKCFNSKLIVENENELVALINENIPQQS